MTSFVNKPYLTFSKYINHHDPDDIRARRFATTNEKLRVYYNGKNLYLAYKPQKKHNMKNNTYAGTATQMLNLINRLHSHADAEINMSIMIPPDYLKKHETKFLNSIIDKEYFDNDINKIIKIYLNLLARG